MWLAMLVGSAQAFLYGGNPEVHVHVQRAAGDLVSGSVGLGSVRVHSCDGTWVDYPVDETIDPVAGFSLAIDAGDLCDVRFVWSTDMSLVGSGSLGTFSLLYAEDTTTVPVDPSIATVPLTPFSVVSGQMTAGAPRLLTSID